MPGCIWTASHISENQILFAAVDLIPSSTHLELPNSLEKFKLPTLPEPVII
jgi:hypothetical protein